MKYFLVIILGILSLNAQGLTLDEAIQAAVQNSHEIKILKLQAQSSSLSETKAFAGFLPKLTMDGRHLFQEKFQELEVPFGNSVAVMPAVQPYTTVGLTAQWNVFNGFKNINEWHAAHYEKVAAEKSLERALDEKKIQIRTLFSEALAAQMLNAVLNENIVALKNHLKDIQVRIRSGVSMRYDLLQGEVQLEEAQTDQLAAENNIQTSRIKLFEALGVVDDGQSLQGELSTEFTQFHIQKIKKNSEEAGRFERADRAVLVAQKERGVYLAKASKYHWMPAVSLFGNYEWYNNINHSITESDQRFKVDYALGVRLSWELFDGGANWAQDRKALLEQKIAEEKLSQWDQRLPSQISELQNRFNYDKVNYQSKLSSLHKAEEAVRLAKGELRAGTRTNSEILDAIVRHNRARAAAIKAQVQAINDMGQLELSLP